MRSFTSSSNAAPSSPSLTRAVPPATASSTAQDNKYDCFEQWLRDNGAQFELLQLAEYDTMDSTSLSHENPSHAMRLPEHPLGSQQRQDNHAMMQQYHNEEKKEASTTVSSLDTSSNSELRGVYAKTYIPPNTVCMSIPRRCLITVEMGQATPIGQLIMQSDLDLDAPKHIFLMVYLLWDRKVNGPRR